MGCNDSYAFLIEYVEPKIKELVLSNKKLWVAGHDYEDIRSECHIYLMKAIHKFNPEINPSFRHYAGMLFKGCIVSMIKKSQQNKSKALNVSCSIDVAHTNKNNGEEFKLQDIIPSGDRNFSDVIEQRDYCANLKEKLYESLTTKEADVFELFLEHYSYEEISDMLGIKTKSVDNSIQRVKKKITICLEDELKEHKAKSILKKKALQAKDKNRKNGSGFGDSKFKRRAK